MVSGTEKSILNQLAGTADYSIKTFSIPAILPFADRFVP